jgi:hypothetical protein
MDAIERLRYGLGVEQIRSNLSQPSGRFVISPWIGIFARLKPQCANACGYLLPGAYCPRQPQVEVFFRLERLVATQTESLESTPAERRVVPNDVPASRAGDLPLPAGYLRRNRLPIHRIKSALS